MMIATESTPLPPDFHQILDTLINTGWSGSACTLGRLEQTCRQARRHIRGSEKAWWTTVSDHNNAGGYTWFCIALRENGVLASELSAAREGDLDRDTAPTRAFLRARACQRERVGSVAGLDQGDGGGGGGGGGEHADTFPSLALDVRSAALACRTYARDPASWRKVPAPFGRAVAQYACAICHNATTDTDKATEERDSAKRLLRRLRDEAAGEATDDLLVE